MEDCEYCPDCGDCRTCYGICITHCCREHGYKYNPDGSCKYPTTEGDD